GRDAGLAPLPRPQRQAIAALLLAGARLVEDRAAAFEVRPNAEVAPRPRHDHRAHVVPLVGLPERVAHLDAHAPRPRVAALGAIQRERRDLVGDLEADLLVLHGSSVNARTSAAARPQPRPPPSPPHP